MHTQLPDVLQITLLRFWGSDKVCRAVQLPPKLCLSTIQTQTDEKAVGGDAGREGHGSRECAGGPNSCHEPFASDAEAGTGTQRGEGGAGEDVEEGLKVGGPGDVVEYQLVAVVMHSGRSTNSGHYYAFVALEDGQGPTHARWLLCDDSDVTDSSFQRAVTPSSRVETPYLLFYQRCAAPPEPNPDPQPRPSTPNPKPSTLAPNV
jgi:hypothetical protein